MIQYVTVHIVCPCGKLLKTQRTSVGQGSGGTTRDSLFCPACKKMVQYAIADGECFTNYK